MNFDQLVESVKKPKVPNWFKPDKHGNITKPFNKGLTSLEGAPEYVEGDFNCSVNKLTNLVGGPEYVEGFYLCNNCNLISLKGAPKIVNGYFDCSSNNLVSLEYAPQTPIDFSCTNNSLTSLKHIPKHLDGSCFCNHNLLTSLEGAPKFIGGSFSCHDNKLTSLEGAPEYIGGHFWCINNPNLPFLELARMDLGNKVKGDIYFASINALVNKAKCTREYYELIKATSTDEQQDITSI